ncbi:MAG: DEAD/DEAH box helicase, partial [Patescibacteria group bacterium]
MTTDTPITELHGVGESLAKKLAILRIKNIDDLIRALPRKYQDYSKVIAIRHIRPGVVTIEAKISQTTGRYVRRGMHITEATASDDSGSVRLVWFNQPYRAAALKSGENYYVSGEFVFKSRRLSIINPSVELKSDFPINTARIIPIYRETKGLKSFQIRRLVRQVSDFTKKMPESLPKWLVKKQKLMPLAEAILQMHFPDSSTKLADAQKRLGFEEVFELTLASLLNKHELHQNKSFKIRFNEKLAKKFVSQLPYKLTDTQRKAIWQAYLDMRKNWPMNRLIEGDVGSGKTVVAAMVALMVINAGYQVVFMAPTELLANQHAETIHNMLKPMGLADK